MALQKQNVSVPFTKGLDLKTDPKQVVPGKLLLLENGVFTSPGRIQKRNGYAAFLKTISGTTNSISSGQGLANFKNELLILTGTEAYSYSDSTSRWSDKQTITNLSISTDQIVRNTYQQTTPDTALHPTGLQVVTYEDSRGGARYCLIDTTTGEQLVTDQLISSTAIKPKAFALGNFLLIFYIDTALNHLNILPIGILNPLYPLATQLVATNINATNPNYDATLFSTHVYYAYNTNANSISVGAINAFLDQNAPETQLGESASSCIGISVDPTDGKIWVAYHNGTQVKYFIFYSTLPFSPFLAPVVVESNSNTILNITLLASNLTANVYYTQKAALPSNNFIKTAALTNAGAVSGLRTFIRSVSICGKPFTYGAQSYITVSFDTTLQPTYFTLRLSDAAVVAKFTPNNGGGTPVKNIIPESYPTGAGQFLIAAQQKDLLTTISGTVYTQTGINVTTLDFIDSKISRVELGANLHLTGGLLTMYDGVSVVEHGFNMFPENVTTSYTLNGGGLAQGSYEYFAVYSWMDAQGQVHYSAPSVGVQNVIPATVTFGAVFSAGAMTMTVSSTKGLFIGQTVTDTTTPGNIPANTTITSITGLVVGLSNPTSNASDTLTGDAMLATPTPLKFQATFPAGSSTITVSSNTGLFVGQLLTDNTVPTNIVAGTRITSINGTTVGISIPTGGTSANEGPTGDELQTTEINSASITVPTLRLTQKKAPVRGEVSIQIYRTLKNQTVPYLITSLTSPLLNNTTIDSVTFTDTYNDQTILGNPYLYTTGGVLENIAPPAFSYVTTYQDRVIGLPEENKNQWWYSKQNVPGSPVEFSDAFVNNVDQAGGNLVSCLKMDSELVFWKETLLYYITGVGPNSTGGQNDFSPPQLIASDVGCSDKNSLVLTPHGVFFKSLKGIYLLDRKLGLSYIGADVEAYNANRIVSANLIEDTQQVRFCLDNGLVLMYDYYVGQWSVFTNHPAVDSVIFQGLFTYVTSSGLVLQETPGKYTDNGEFIKLKLTTSWLSFTGLQGFQRVYQMLFLGEYYTPHNVAVYAAYDFNPFATQQNVTYAGKILGTGVYGSDATYGATSPYGGPPPTYQFRVNFNRQKCEAIQITIEDNQLGASFGQNLALSAFGFRVGTKGTLDKIVAQGSNRP